MRRTSTEADGRRGPASRAWRWIAGVGAAASLLIGGCAAQEVAGDDATSPETATEALAELVERVPDREERMAELERLAAEDGEVLLYAVSNVDLLEDWVEGFESDYPDVDLEFVRLVPATDLQERVLLEADAEQHLVDVTFVTSFALHDLHEAQVLADHHEAAIPPGFPSRYLDASFGVVQLIPNVISWNREAVADPDAVPRTWDDLLEPEHAGCAMHAEPHALLATLIETRGLDEAERWLEGFLDNDGVLVDQQQAASRSLASGEVPCAAYLFLHDVEPLIVDDGAPLEWHAPDPTPAHVNGVSIAEQAPNPYAAALLMHWMLDPDGGQATLGATGRLPAHPDVPVAYERLEPWGGPESDQSQRLRPVMPERAEQFDEDVWELIERHLR